MIRLLMISAILILVLSCTNKHSEDNTHREIQTKKGVEDSSLVKFSGFPKGDVRRYGLFPNQPINIKLLNRLIDFSGRGITLFFPEGDYDMDLILKGVSDVTMDFNNATITGSVQVINSDSIGSNNVGLYGQLTVLDKVFLRKSRNIRFDTLILKTDTLKSFHKAYNRGVSIYAGTENVKIKQLSIFDTGGFKEDFYTYTAAALQVHGWNNNPNNLEIENLFIRNAHRTAVYLTGKNHSIGKVKIENFGIQGSNQNMFGLEDASSGEEKDFTGFWINKCGDCFIDSLELRNNSSLITSLKFGIGPYSRPSIINNLNLEENTKKALIKDDILTNVLVKNEY